MKQKVRMEDLRKLSRSIRHDILHYSYLNEGPHIGSCLSAADILAVLYGAILHVDPKKPKDENRDRFILSKGHAVLALYSLLAHLNFFPKKTLATYLKHESHLLGHPKHEIPGIEFSSGSLGHGLSVGAGMALSAKFSGQTHRVFVLVSDGELNEGSSWEAIQFAAHHHLDNLVMIVDNNGLQAFGQTKKVLDLEPLGSKFRAFRWAVSLVDGHNLESLQKSFTNIPKTHGRPTAIIAKTVKGKGISFMEGRLEWHYLNLTRDLHKKAVAENSRY